METVTFKLDQPLKFDSKDGTPNNEAYELMLIAPSYNERQFARKLKQKLTGAMMYVTRQSSGETKKAEEAPKEDEVMDSQAILFMLQSVPEGILDWAEFADWFANNCAKVISVEEGVGLTSALVKQLEVDTMDTLIGTYLANFTWTSLMKGTGSQ